MGVQLELAVGTHRVVWLIVGPGIIVARSAADKILEIAIIGRHHDDKVTIRGRRVGRRIGVDRKQRSKSRDKRRDEGYELAEEGAEIETGNCPLLRGSVDCDDTRAADSR